MAIFSVTVDVWRGPSLKNSRRTRMKFLVDAVDSDTAESDALKAASSYTDGYKVRAVEFVSLYGPKVGPFCISKRHMKN